MCRVKSNIQAKGKALDAFFSFRAHSLRPCAHIALWVEKNFPENHQQIKQREREREVRAAK